MASPLPKSRLQACKDEVYVAKMPLRATKGPPQLFMSAAYSLNLWDLQHFMVIVKPSSPALPPVLLNLLSTWVFVFDFQPKDPENIYVALAALSGRAVPGVVLERRLTKLPRSKWWLIGSSRENGVEAAHVFNKTWNTDLRIGSHDCRDYANGLVEYLTGEKQVLERLRSDISK